MKNTKTFEVWYASIKEAESTMSSDVDTIMTSLETLARELAEELSSPEFDDLNEIESKGNTKVWQWIWWMPKARKAQAKVNKIKLNITDMASAAADAKNTDQQEVLDKKVTNAKNDVKDLQKMVDDKFSVKGKLVQRALHNEKIIGQIAAIKRATGLEDDPEKIATYKDKMAELQQKYKDDLEAIEELEPSKADIKAEKDRKTKEDNDKKIAKDKQDALDAQENETPEQKAEREKTEKIEAAQITIDATKKIHDDIPSDDESKKADKLKAKIEFHKAQLTKANLEDDEEAKTGFTQEIADATKELKDLDPPAPTEDELATAQTAINDTRAKYEDPALDGEDKKNDKIKANINYLKAQLVMATLKNNTDDKTSLTGEIETETAKLTPEPTPEPTPVSDSLVIRATAAGLNELATEIESKFDWQVTEGTVLYSKYNEMIRLSEHNITLNESRYQNLSIKDRFARLM